MTSIASGSTALNASAALAAAKLAAATVQKQKSTQALQTLKGLNDPNSYEHKAHAKERLVQLRKQLQQLTLMGASPRQIAQMAKDLAAAVKEFRGTGGSDDAVSSAGADVPPPVDTTGADDAPGAETESAGAGNTSQAADTPAGDAVAKAAADGSSATADASDPAAGNVANPYDKALEAQTDDTARRSAQAAADAKADKEFLDQAQGLAEGLKAVAKDPRSRNQPGDPGETDKAFRQVDKAIEDLNRKFQVEVTTAGRAFSLSA